MTTARPSAICCVFALGICSFAARAEQPSQTADNPPPPPQEKSLWERSTFLPDPGGLREQWADRGITYLLSYTGEAFGNPIGGYRQGAIYEGLVTAAVDVDLEKLAGWTGLKFHVSALQIHGASGTDKYVRDFGRFSSLDAPDTTRLDELWLDGSYFGDVINFRIGQITDDTEYGLTQGGALFIHSNFGQNQIVSYNVPDPSFPEAAPGVRLRLNTPDASGYAQASVFSGNPDADRLGDPNPNFRQGNAENNYGIRFPISGNQGALAMFEIGYLRNQGKDDQGLPTTFRLGGYYRTGEISDVHLDNTGRSLASPQSTGRPAAHEGTGGVYAAFEQVLYRDAPPATSSAPATPPADGKNPPADAPSPPPGRELRFFTRAGLAPEDRSMVDGYFEAGLTYRGLIPTRDQDLIGLGFTYTDMSGDLRRRVADENRFNNTQLALPDYEAVLELTYQLTLTPWLQIQPDAQMIFHPGGSGQNNDALVLGVRTVITF